MSSDDCDEDGPPFPWTVKLAGRIWIGFGLVGLLTTLFAYTATGSKGAGCCFTIFGLSFSYVFLQVGVRTAEVETEDTLRNGIGSTGIGMFCFALCGLMALNGMLNGAAVFAGPGSLLVTAGVLAIGGRTQYLTWKALPPPEEVPECAPDADLRDTSAVHPPE